MISLTKIINNNLSTLTKSDLIVCDYFQDNLNSIPDMTLLEIAQQTYSSKSNILRLLKKLGFSGFTDFKYFLLAQSNEKNEQSYLDDIMPKLKSIDFEFVSKKLSTLIVNSNKIYLFATGQDQQIQANSFSTYLLKAGIISTFVPLNVNADLTNNIISSIEHNDLIIIFSSKGNNETLKKFFSELSSKNQHIVSFTSFKNGWIQEKAELAISLNIQQFQEPTLVFQSGMMHLLINILATKLVF